MAGPRRSKRLQSCSKPDQDRVTKIARVSKDQETTEKVVQGENKRIGKSAMEEPLDQGVDRPSSKDASPNRASEEALERQLRGRELLEEAQQRHDRALAERSKWMDDGLVKFRRAIQWDVGLGYRQGHLFRLWNYFDGRIKNFAESAGFRDLPWDRLDEAVQQRFVGYSPCAQQLFETPLRKNFDYDDEFLRFQYPNWRFTTINFYYTLKERSNRKAAYFRETRVEPGCVVKILKKALGQYFPENPDLFFEGQISTLANVVAEFELVFDCGRHTLRLVFHDPNTKEACRFPFSARAEGFDTQVVMESVGPETEDECNGAPVELVVSPVLVFYGEQDGWDYHVPNVAVPMKVCVGYIDGLSHDWVIETKEDGEGDGEEEVKIIKDKEGGTKDEDGKKDEDEE
ncbi:hypothetical protein FBULB1_8340 [Fusarium bulbicola]|nr:hypothetical protein FBULB1_8340 [Fusarium bulbicola]